MRVIDAARIYKEMMVNIVELERLVLQVMRHPDVTHEQVLTVKDSYTKMWASHNTLKATLRAKFPGGRTLTVLPWNK